MAGTVDMSANEKWPDPPWSVPPYVGSTPVFRQTTFDPSLSAGVSTPTIIQAVTPPSNPALLLQNGSYLLLENGSKLLLQ